MLGGPRRGVVYVALFPHRAEKSCAYQHIHSLDLREMLDIIGSCPLIIPGRLVRNYGYCVCVTSLTSHNLCVGYGCITISISGLGHGHVSE